MRLWGLLLAASVAEEEVDGSGGSAQVKVLTGHSFDDAVAQPDVSMVKFTAPWCARCKEFKPKFETAAETLVPEGIGMFDVNCDEEKDLCARFKVEGYPTMYTFKKDGDKEGTKYMWRREAEDLVKFLRVEREPVKPISTAEHATAFTTIESLGMIGYFSDEQSEAAKVFNEFCKEHALYLRFGKVTKGADLSAPLGPPEAVFFVRHMATLGKKEEAVVRIAGDQFSTASELAKRAAEALPAVRVLDDSMRPFATVLDKPIVMYHLPFDAGLVYNVNRFRKVTSEFVKDFDFYVMDVEGKEKELEEQYNVVLTDRQALTSNAAGASFGMSEGVVPGGMGKNSEAIAKFLDSLRTGKAEASVLSEVPPPEDDQPLKKLVGKTWNSHVVNGDKDHFVMFHAPWCGHCKAAKPDWKILAKAFHQGGVKSMQVSLFDATANKVPSPLEVKSYPKFYFFPAGKADSPIEYDDTRSMMAWAKFAQKHATHRFEINQVYWGWKKRIEFGEDDGEEEL
eukprot:CAMPEP_0204368160 /NCGR_PEP_ID=MMETSP0469-20131031/43979_1 /ASSEMBLY_ACC=CAM_ASM_000384 /TAXON_ID=2969 /ORGANISM="Oxyrrhis marina" /LENGTH=509 /DNA_ID=CAMNT_0051357677 /DNA_START=38 /DNA_END=1567 /DNA_ORIENTATION=-